VDQGRQPQRILFEVFVVDMHAVTLDHTAAVSLLFSQSVENELHVANDANDCFVLYDRHD